MATNSNNWSPSTVKRFQYTFNAPVPGFQSEAESTFCACYETWVSKKLEEDGGQNILFWVFQFERGEETERLHVQGFIRLKQPRSFAFVKRLVGMDTDRAHLEKAFASDQENFEYCTKQSDRVEFSEPFVFGEPSERGQGARTDLVIATDMLLKEGRHLSDVAVAQPSTFVRYHRGLAALLAITRPVMRSLSWDLSASNRADFRWYYGEPGTGKTADVYREFGASNVYAKSSVDKWFDGYNPYQHTCILIDDYRDNTQLSYPYLLTLLDIYPAQAEIKGGHVWIGNCAIIITCNYHFEIIFTNHGERKHSGNFATDTPFARRITRCVEFRHGSSPNATWNAADNSSNAD